MTIYISLPITGYDESERREKCEQIREHLLAKYGEGTFAVSPFDIADMVRDRDGEPTYGDYLGADIRFIIDEADAVYVYTENGMFPQSKGVRLEYSAATLYDKKVLF